VVRAGLLDEIIGWPDVKRPVCRLVHSLTDDQFQCFDIGAGIANDVESLGNVLIRFQGIVQVSPSRQSKFAVNLEDREHDSDVSQKGGVVSDLTEERGDIGSQGQGGGNGSRGAPMVQELKAVSTVQDFSGFVVDLLVDAEDDWRELKRLFFAGPVDV